MSDEENTDEKPDKQGVMCLECKSVIFSVSKLLRHIQKRNHNWFKSGDDLALNARTLVDDPDRVFNDD